MIIFIDNEDYMVMILKMNNEDDSVLVMIIR